MLVSGGQILAIDKVNTGNTILGDGVQKPLNVNTDLIATTSSVSSVSSTLEHQIDVVSGKFNDYYPKTETSAADEISAAFEKFKTTQTIVSAGKNVGVYSAYNEAGAIVYTVSADDVEQREVKIVGDNGIQVSYDDAASAWNIGVSANYQSAGNYVSADDFDKYKNDVTQKFDNTSAWVNETFQPKGEYVSATTFDEYKTEVQNTLNKKQDVSAMSAYAQSAWVDTNYQKKGNYVSADDFDEYKTKVEQQFTNTSSWANGKFQEKGEYVSASDFEDYKEKVEQDFKDTSAWANETFQPIGEYISASEKFLSANALDDISGKWESVYDTTVTASGSWNEASAFAANSAKFVTSASVEFDTALAYFLKKTEENVAWSGVDLSNLGKMYNISSLTPELISAGVSADEQNNQFYVLSAAKPGEVSVPGISGENGVSAQYNAKENKYVVGLSSSPAYASFTATTTADNGVYTPATYSESYNVGNGVTLEDNTISVGPGLWHVTIYAKVTNTEVSPDYYDTVLTCNSIKNIVQFDNSYIHTEYINLDADVVSNDSLAINIELEDVPANSTVVIEQLQLHRIVTGSVVNEGGNTYTPGDGISIDNYQIDFKAGDGLAVDAATNNVNVQAGSGVFIDANNKLSIKLGKGLAFSSDGDVFAIETDTQVNEVVETVETLKKELDGKLTTNMNISDAKSVGNPWNGDSNADNLAASLFTIPLQHNLTSASTISFITTHNLGQSDHAPLMLGILEYNFDYFVTANNELGVSSRSQTKWIADTGPIWVNGDGSADIYGKNPAVDGAGRYTYQLKNLTTVISSYVEDYDGKKYYNEVGPCMRSDRAYYLALFAHDPNNYSWFLSDDGFNTNTIHNTDPAISFRVVNCTYYNNETDTTGVSIDNTFLNNVRNGTQQFSMSGLPWWGSNRGYNDIDKIQRPYVMIRNPRL